MDFEKIFNVVFPYLSIIFLALILVVAYFSKTYGPSLVKSSKLMLRNFTAVILFTMYLIVFYLGYFFLTEKMYIESAALFIVFSFCISSIFYITGCIVKNGRFTFTDFIKSFKVYYLRANFILIFWYAIFFFINQFVITPISSIVPQPVVLYGIVIPSILVIFFIFNTLPENIYISDEKFEILFINSAKFMEKHWKVWIIPTIIIILLVNLFDHRLSIVPSIGYLDSYGILLKLQDWAFYIRSIIIVLALIYRGLLYQRLNDQPNKA